MKTARLIVFSAIVALGVLAFATSAFAWNLEGSCVGVPSEINVGESVTWTADQTSTAQPDDGTYYTWLWSGNESLSGTTQSTSKSYTIAGVKNASVEISLIIWLGNIETITRSCQITVIEPSPPPPGCTQNCGGGGMDQPTVVLLQKAVKEPLAFVYLSQIPYTGLSGTGKILLFLLGLVTWSALVVYILRSHKVMGLAERLFNNVRARFSPDSNMIFKTAGQVLDTFEISDDLLLNTKPMESLLAVEAKKERTLISPDGLRAVVETASAKGEEPLATLGKAIENAKTKFQREDGWLLLNKEKIDASLLSINIAVPTYGAPEKITANISETPTTPVITQENYSATNQTTEINTFVSLLARGDEKGVANHLRALREGGKSVERFIRETIMEIDGAYRARVESENNRRNFVLSQIISRWSGEKTEEVISILLSIVDKNYKNSAIGLKLAVMRIAELKE